MAPNPTQTSAASPQEPLTLYRVTVVGRTTPAVNYRPRHDDTPIDFQGTSLLPKAKGHATVSGEKVTSGSTPSSMISTRRHVSDPST